MEAKSHGRKKKIRVWSSYVQLRSAYGLTIAKGGLKIKPSRNPAKIIRQRGLKLEPGRGPVAVLVLDRLEKPTEN